MSLQSNTTRNRLCDFVVKRFCMDCPKWVGISELTEFSFTEIGERIGNHIYCYMWDAITRLCINFNGLTNKSRNQTGMSNRVI